MTSLVALTIVLLGQGQAPKPPDRPDAAPSGIAVVAAIESALADAIARAERSVVAIHRTKGRNPRETLAVRGREPSPRADQRDLIELRRRQATEDFISFDYGSGVVIGGDGEILTAFHVVQGAEWLVVVADGGQSFEAEVIAADPRSDLAVIAPVERPDAERPRLKPISIGDAEKLRKGSFLVALGNPFNAARHDGSPSASWGILSNTARRLEVDPEPGIMLTKWRLENYPTLLQLDAKLNLGMSGGAVINLKGELVGLTTTASSPAGFDAQAGYAIPMDRMGRRIVETLRQGKEVEYGLLGIKSEDGRVNKITSVSPNSPAGRGLLQVGDEIVGVNGQPISSFDSLILAVGIYPPGEPIRLKIRRAGKLIERTLVLAKYPIPGEVIATNRPKPWRGLRVDYATTAMNSAPNAFDLDPTAGGVIVTNVEENSPAASAGLKKGLLILRAAGRPVLSPRAFAEAVEGRDGPVTLDTEIGAVTVAAPGSSRPKPDDRPRREGPAPDER